MSLTLSRMIRCVCIFLRSSLIVLIVSVCRDSFLLARDPRSLSLALRPYFVNHEHFNHYPFISETSKNFAIERNLSLPPPSVTTGFVTWSNNGIYLKRKHFKRKLPECRCHLRMLSSNIFICIPFFRKKSSSMKPSFKSYCYISLKGKRFMLTGFAWAESKKNGWTKPLPKFSESRMP